MKGNIILNMKEQRLNDIMVKLLSNKITIYQACRLTGLSERQMYRKKKNYKECGINSIPHKLKINPSKKGYSQKFKNKIIKLYKEEYFGWNFHHFNDTIQEEYDINVSDSFIYNLLTKNNIESPYKYKKRRNSHPPRPRRENAGELIQVDASKHQWLPNDDTYYHLHGGIDDATGIVTSCFLREQEDTFGYQMIMLETIKNYGIPECLYTDYRTVFKSNKKELSIEDELAGKKIKNTRFANMLSNLGTDIKSTIDPKSKGRIERLWKTFQDRLCKELKKKNINTLEKANQYISDVFLPKYNARFASDINYNKSVFVSVDENFDFNKELAIWDERKVYHNSYLRFDNNYYIIKLNSEKSTIYTNNPVKVYQFLDGTKHILFNNTWYDLETISIDKIEIPVQLKNTKSQLEINLSKSHKPINSPWAKWNPNKIF